MARSDSAATNPRPRLPGVGLFRRSVLMFLVALVLFIAAMPLAQHLATPALLEGPMLAVALIAGVLAVGGRRRSLVFATLLVLPALGARWLYHLRPEPITHSLFLALGSVLFVFVIAHLLRFILRAPRVDSEVLAAGIATYLVLGMTWTLLYLLVDVFAPDAFLLAQTVPASQGFDSFNALYFSFVTLTTMGYGDITPVSPIARMLAILEAVTGVLYLSVLVARLVTLYTGRQA
jgi:hypothetical protein